MLINGATELKCCDFMSHMKTFPSAVSQLLINRCILSVVGYGQ